MKTYRFVYWFNVVITELYIKAENKEKAIEIFRKRKGNRKIVNIECYDD
jgi:hypothetical protein